MVLPLANTPIILLDIEGTTTPVDYVFGVLFPFAAQHLETFLTEQGQDSAVQEDLKTLWEDYQQDMSQGLGVPLWNWGAAIEAQSYVQYLIAHDRKATGLKSLQGKIWEAGYEGGQLRSQIFPDVAPALHRWVSQGKALYIFSSGSVQAQQSLFRHTEAGDLTGLLQGYFDTRVGSKRDPSSYQAIATAIGADPETICFISDVVEELQAAQAVGFEVLLSVRSPEVPPNAQGFTIVTTFEGL
jgi:enolase-phosphatase E1